MSINWEEVLCRLAEIHKACATATSPEDTNVNLIIDEIDRLASQCIATLNKNKTNQFKEI